MEPTRNTQATLVDLLDRVLDKGLILNTDVIISVAGIPLLGVNLKAALAGVETMLKYGIWEDWEAAQRAIAKKEYREKQKHARVPLQPGEKVLLKVFASLWEARGIWQVWRPGYLYITDRRIFCYQKEPAQVLWEAGYEEIKGVAVENRLNVTRQMTGYLFIFLTSGRIVQLHPPDATGAKQAIAEVMRDKGLPLEENLSPPADGNYQVLGLLEDGEAIKASGEMWYAEPSEKGAATWRRGFLYLTPQRLFWWSNFDQRVNFSISPEQLRQVELADRDLGGMLGQKRVLLLHHGGGGQESVAIFSGTEAAEAGWQEALGELVEGAEQALGDRGGSEQETCPRCGRSAAAQTLLDIGCAHCGWISARAKRERRKEG